MRMSLSESLVSFSALRRVASVITLLTCTQQLLPCLLSCAYSLDLHGMTSMPCMPWRLFTTPVLVVIHPVASCGKQTRISLLRDCPELAIRMKSAVLFVALCALICLSASLPIASNELNTSARVKSKDFKECKLGCMAELAGIPCKTSVTMEINCDNQFQRCMSWCPPEVASPSPSSAAS
eukprot:IDg15100t1